MANAKQQLRVTADGAAEKISAFLLEALEAEKTYSKRVRCKCGVTHDVEFSLPDWNARANAVDKLLQYGYGKPAQQKEEAKPATAVVKDIANASDDELAAMTAQEGA